MSRSKKILILVFLMTLTVSFAGTVYLDLYLKNQYLKHTLYINTTKFAEKVLQLNIEVYDALYKLEPPAQCNPETFESLIYQYKHIKNLGVIRDNTIVCDVYQGKRFETPLENYSTFENEQGEVYKFWIRDEYISIAEPHGYFIEYDMNYYLDFLVDREISGFIIFGRQSNELWFDVKRHPLSEEDETNIKQHLLQDFNQLNQQDDLQTQVQDIGSFLYYLLVTDQGSIAAAYIHKEYLPPFTILSGMHLMGGLIFGFIFAFAIFYLFFRGRNLKRLLISAIKKEEFYMVYQPLVDLKTDKANILGFEALVRWQLKNGDFIRPDVFIPLAEESGLTKRLTHCLINKIFDDLHPQLQRNPDLYVSINITPTDLHDLDLILLIQEQLQKYSLSPSQVVVELTERILTSEKAYPGLQAINDAGIQISIDDFGTGSSNIKYLAELNPDVIKIDRSFVEWSDSEGPTAQLLGKLIAMGKDFKLKVVVEGVETAAQALRCRQLGADVGQGYFWYKPAKIDDINALLSGIPDHEKH